MVLALRQLGNIIQNDYFKYVTIRESEKTRKEEDVTNFKYSRALVAFYLKNYANCPEDKIGKRVVDGYKDNGIDGLYFNHIEKVLYVVQSKWIKNATSGIQLGDVHKVIGGIKDLMIPNLKTFNQEIVNLRSELEMALLEPNIRIEIALIASTQQPLPGESKHVLDEFLIEQNVVTNFINYEYIDLRNLHDVLRNGAIDKPIDTDILLMNWSDIQTPVKAIAGMINGNDLAELHNAYGKRIFAPNIRYFLGKTEVNDAIIETCSHNPSLFWYLNNGITAITARLDKKPIGGAGRANGLFSCSGFYIVNGAQTTGALAEAKRLGIDLSEISVNIRIIEISEAIKDLGVQITRSNNTQNRVDSRDFVSLDINQERIYEELLLEGIIYTYKSGDTVPEGNDGFSFDEAAVALACSAKSIDLMVQAKREVSKLWSNTSKAPYKILFNDGTEGPMIWKRVKIMKKVESRIKQRLPEFIGRDKLIMVHGNRFILYLTYTAVINDEGDAENTLEDDFLISAVDTACINLKTAIDGLYEADQLASLFKNREKCTIIDAAIKKMQIVRS